MSISLLLRHHLLIIFWLIVYVLVIFQDYLFSVLRTTGFYWSEVTLFNCYWLLFIPVYLGARKWIMPAGEKVVRKKLMILVSMSVSCSMLHVLVFSIGISGISAWLFTPAHPFMNVVFASISNDFSITLLIYLLLFYLIQPPARGESKTTEPTTETYQTTFTVKQGNQLRLIDASAVYYICSNKPYIELHTEQEKYLLSQSLTTLEHSLPTRQFVRIHRSAMVNRKFIKAIVSRKNGDYDLVLQNEQKLRMSRHYRSTWAHLLSGR
uniref:LytTR family DNA-binding domain-containing protein n=1 Tax=Roseihalotalea indica TaxID=2867963 RepID=A0AA49JEK7_9BACT|nr:LytTR family DNA-binding domain-containing protein [Tunicatimonas sp. TK19036]